jgi:guanyl-specific ribonuclease Sa
LSARGQWLAILGGFLVLVMVGVVLGAIVSAATRQSSEDAEQASSSEAEPEESTEEEPTREAVAEETFESFEEQEARRKRALTEARTPEERIRAIVEYMPQFEKLQPDDPERVWVRFYNNNGCLDVLVKFRDSGGTLGLGTRADWFEATMWQVYKAIHSDRAAHEAVCDVYVEAYGPITDDYGQEREEKLYETSLSRDTAQRVNWSNADAANYTELWQVEYAHPEVEAERIQGNAQQVLDCLQEGGMFDFDWLECP